MTDQLLSRQEIGPRIDGLYTRIVFSLERQATGCQERRVEKKRKAAERILLKWKQQSRMKELEGAGQGSEWRWDIMN